MRNQIQPSTPVARGRDLAKMDEILERVRPEFVFVDPRQAPIYASRFCIVTEVGLS